MKSSSLNVASLSLALLLALAAGFGQQPALATDGLGLTSMLGGIGAAADNLVNPMGGGSLMGGALGAIPNVLNAATGMVGGITAPVMGAIGSMSGGILGQSGLGNVLSNTLGGTLGGADGIVGNTMRLTQGALGGVASGLTNGINGLAQADDMRGVGSMASAAAAAQAGTSSALSFGSQLRNNYKREAIAEGANLMAAAGNMAATREAVNGLAASAAAANRLAPSAANLGAAVAGELMMDSAAQRAAMAATAAESAAASQGAAGAVVEAGLAANAALNQGAAVAQNVAQNQAALVAANSVLGGGRQALAVDAIKNAQAESAAAGAEMVAHGAVNARSASMASNAYREAKLASARDRVDIAGTIQNSARISDAAIATHDAATKAEDSLLGSELAVDSASTVLDSDAAYIPPVTNSLLRSLPYGRLGLRNIIPKPLTQPSVMLPDVWLNGVPVNYFNVPLRMLPYGIGPAESVGALAASGAAMASGAIINGQPFIANNGLVLNGLVFDPAYAYLAAANLNGIVGSSLAPILANGQLEAQDELAVANAFNIKQLNGAGMAATYQGYGRLNPVPMITGSVSDVTLMPTTTIGTTYPIGSALVIEPRDSYFQDYTDNASSRQNMDERQQ